MLVKKQHVIIRIEEEERDKLFTKPITCNDGSVIKLWTGMQADEGSGDSYTQTVTVGRILAVGEGCGNIQVGDAAIMDYTVDAEDKFVVERDDKGKTVCVRVVTTYKQEDHIKDATRRTNHPTIIHLKGEVDEFSQVIGVVRDEVVYPVAPFIFCQHVVVDDEFKKRDSGLWLQDEDREFYERQVLSVYDGCEVSVGEIIVAHRDAVFDRKYEDRKFDIIPMYEVVGIVRPNLKAV